MEYIQSYTGGKTTRSGTVPLLVLPMLVELSQPLQAQPSFIQAEECATISATAFEIVCEGGIETLAIQFNWE